MWVAYQILRTEQQEREIKTGLWKELLRELSSQNKISLDSALKVQLLFLENFKLHRQYSSHEKLYLKKLFFKLQKACGTLKLSVFSSNSLAIYRWSQQAIDTPMDHPLLPLLWQNFFSLFLARVPTSGGY